MWPFARRGGKKAANLKSGGSATVAEKNGLVAETQEGPSDDALRSSPTRRRKMRTLPRSSSPSMHHRVRSSKDSLTALPNLQTHDHRLAQSPHLRPVLDQHGNPFHYNFQPDNYTQSQSSQARARGKLQRPQSLRRSDAPDSSIVRRKSSKKTEHDPIREEEIRAMSMPLTKKRPAGNSGMLRRESKKVKGGPNRHFDRDISNISLPPQDSIHSSMSGASASRGWRVSALDMLTPRPTVRYLSSPQPFYYTGARTSPLSYHEKHDFHDFPTTFDQTGRRSSRIDDLADTLDAGALREIMERDKRRKEKKRKTEDERLRRRLERRAEKQRAVEQGGTPPTPRREAVGGVGLGIEKDKSTSTPMEDVRRSTPSQSPPQRLVTPKRSPKNNQLPTPVESPVEGPVAANAHAANYPQTRASPSPSTRHTRGTSNVSEMPALLSEMVHHSSVEVMDQQHDPRGSGSLHPVETTDTTATSKKGSRSRRSSDGKRMGVFASFFRRKNRSQQDQGHITPSEASEASFSNTSHESMPHQHAPAHFVATPSQPIKIRQNSSGVPQRTLSKFREDLPEFPLSPPDSRVQSPEGTASTILSAQRQSSPTSDLRLNADSPRPSGRTDSPVSAGVPATGIMSQSLASVDSEGSWLSGKPLKRFSNKSHMRSSVGSLSALKRNDDFNASYEELGIPDDEYFKRLAPQPHEPRRSALSAGLDERASSSVMALTDVPTQNDDATSDAPSEELVKISIGRQPTIVHHQPRVKSTVGLLSYWQADQLSPELQQASAVHPDEADALTSHREPIELQRARSVDLGTHHMRQLSAGSAKLLNIPARHPSVNSKRSSTGSQKA